MESSSFPAQLSFITDLFSNTRLRQDFVATIVDKLQVWTGCQCVGIRIVNPDSYMPYEAYVGFSQEFWDHENWLSLREHQCGCIRIVNNETLPADQPILTEKGSILSNDLQAFGESLSPEDATLYRGKCIECGFGSLALVPIRQQDRIIGLIHLADKRTHLLPPALIQTLEALTAPIAEVIDRFNTENVLGENRKLLSQAQKIAHIGSWKLDITTNRMAWSDEVYRIFGCEPQEFDATYEDFLDLIHSDDRAAVDEAYSSSVREGRDNYEIEHRIIRRISDEVRYIHEHCVHERDSAGAIVQSIGVVQDITERKQSQMALHDAEQKAQYQLSFHRIAAETAAALATATSDIEFDTAINQCLQCLGLLFEVDRSYVFQFSDNRAYTTNTHEWCADGIAPVMDSLQNLLMDDWSWLTTRLLSADVLYARVADLPPEAGTIKAELQRQGVQSFLLATTHGAQGKLAGFIGFDSVHKERSWRDDELDMIQTIAGVLGSLSVSKRSEKMLRASHKKLKAKNSLLDSLSKTDQLTGIANRRRTQQVIEQEIDRFNRYSKPFCIFLFDIDHFKAVNDTHGHEVGDQVLVELVGLVQLLIRRTDTLGRWGGEEFILVCPETALPTAQTIADKICTTVREYKFARDLAITLSIGVSEIQSGATLKEILVEVDRKMYLAKQKGRDQVES